MATWISRLPLYSKYPFLVSLEEFVESFYGTRLPVEFFLKKPEIVERIKTRLSASIGNRRYRPTSNELVEVVSFYLALIVATLSNRWALSKFIDYESKRFSRFLGTERSDFLAALSRRMGLRVEYLGDEFNPCGELLVLGEDKQRGRQVTECLEFRLPIPEYLTYSEKLLADPKWRLVNRYVKNGYVYLNKRDLARILEEVIKRKLHEAIPAETGYPESGSIGVLEELTKFVNELTKEVRGFVEEVVVKEEPKGEIVEEVFPPCIKHLIAELKQGKHLSHHERFAVATFLINIGTDVEYVLNLMRYSPDFNEKIARYQVEHLAGLRGARKKYLVYSCDKMKSLGICVAECGTKNPLQYYFRELRKLRGDKKRSSRSRGSQNPQGRKK